MTFVQFYYYHKNKIGESNINFNNGFSSVWNHIKNLGNIVWVNIHKDGIFPEVTSPTYISCCWREEFEYIRKWCYARPDINFIVGGPGITQGDFKSTLPNITLEKRQMYEVMNCGQKFELWNLEFPKELLKTNPTITYHYSFASNTRCYWGKCTFCGEGATFGETLDMEDIPIINPGKNFVWINKLALAPEDMLRIFPKFKPESNYNFYMRGDKKVLNILDDVPITTNMYPCIGVEFPSDRMYRYMNKGTTVDTLLKVMLKFLEKKGTVYVMFIEGWPNLVKEDVESVRNFLSVLEPYKNQLRASTQTLYTLDENKIPKDKVRPLLLYHKKFYVHKLDKEQQALKEEVSQLYRQFGFIFYNEFGSRRVEELVEEYERENSWRKVR
jgi:hypothetical protein